MMVESDFLDEWAVRCLCSRVGPRGACEICRESTLRYVPNKQASFMEGHQRSDGGCPSRARLRCNGTAKLI